jgi:hypothetical protein
MDHVSSELLDLYAQHPERVPDVPPPLPLQGFHPADTPCHVEGALPQIARPNAGRKEGSCEVYRNTPCASLPHWHY